MDNLLITVIGSSVVIVGAIIFATTMIKNHLIKIHKEFNKTSVENIDLLTNEIKILSERSQSDYNNLTKKFEDSLLKLNEIIHNNQEQQNKRNFTMQETLSSNIDKTKETLVNNLKAMQEKLVVIDDTLQNRIESLKVEYTSLLEKNRSALTETLETLGKDKYSSDLKNHDALILAIDRSKLHLADAIKSTHKEINISSTETKEKIESIESNLSTQNEKTKKSLEKQFRSLFSSFEKYQIENKTQLENSFQNTVSIVNHLRLDNLINVSNEISKYKNSVVEDDFFLQELGSCKIIRFTDKNTGEITEVYYDENGEKSHTQTLLDGKLKYRMQYENRLLSEGVEYDENEQVIFAYIYDKAGEISTKIEYEYDKSGKKTEKSKTQY